VTHSVPAGSADGSVREKDKLGFELEALSVTVLLPVELLKMIAPVLVLPVPKLNAFAPWTDRVPVKLALDEIV
jgi:hypothetical protein